MIAALAPAQVCAFVAALLATAAVLCRPRHPAVRGRLCDRPRGRAMGGPAADVRDAHGAGACMAGVRKTDVPGPVGIAAVLAAARAGLRAGGTMTEAFARQDAVGFATPRLTQARLLRLLEASRTVGRPGARPPAWSVPSMPCTCSTRRWDAGRRGAWMW